MGNLLKLLINNVMAPSLLGICATCINVVELRKKLRHHIAFNFKFTKTEKYFASFSQMISFSPDERVHE